MNNYFWYAVALIWGGIILGLLTFATYGMGYIMSGVVMWARIISQILGVASLFGLGIFFHWLSHKVSSLV